MPRRLFREWAHRPLRVESLERRNLLAGFALHACASDAVVVADHIGGAGQVDASSVNVDLRLPQGLPAKFQVDVCVRGERWTMELEKHTVFGPNTRFLVDNGSGKLVETPSGPDRSYLGRVIGQAGSVIGAQLTEQGLMASIFGGDLDGPLSIVPMYDPQHPGRHVLHLAADGASPSDAMQAPEESAAHRSRDTGGGVDRGPVSGSLSRSPEGGGPTLPPDFEMDVLEFEVGVEIGSRSFLSSTAYNGNLATAQASAASVATNMDARYLPAAGLKHTVGTVIIRTDAASDPLRDAITGSHSSGLTAFRGYWNAHPDVVGSTHDLAVYHVAAPPSGLAYVNSVGSPFRYALSAGNGATSWANGTVVHEFGHSWNLRHVGDTPIVYESKPRNFSGSHTAGGEDVFISVMHGGGDHNIGRLASDEAQVVLAAKASHSSFGTPTSVPPVRPFGRRDVAYVGSQPMTIDVVANDYDANNDVLDVRLLDTVSQQGAALSLSVGSGPGGRSEILYTPPAQSSGQTDFFHYTVVDSSGRTDWGAVYVETTAVTVDRAADSYAYDFGTPDSPVFRNADVEAVRISPATTGDVTWGAAVEAIDYPASGQNDYNRDLVFGTQPVSWRHPLQPGRWRVVVNMSDPGAALDNMYVTAEGQPGLTDVDRPIGQNQTVSFEVDVFDGELNLEFGDADQVRPRWALNRVVLQQLDAYPLPLLPGDYNLDGAVDAADFTVFRDTLGQSVLRPYAGADGDGDRVVDSDDFHVWVDHFGMSLVATPLIDANAGNGDFAVDQFTDVSVFGGGTSSAVIDLSRDRALRSEGVTGRGISIDGWDFERVLLEGGNSAFGNDGSFGFAPAAGMGPGETGQAFVNSGSMIVRSDTIGQTFQAGDQVRLAYLLGTDAGNADVRGQATLIFDAGLPTEQTYVLPERTATGLTTPVQGEQLRLLAPAQTVEAAFLLDGGVGARTLLDGVRLERVAPGREEPPRDERFLIDAALGNGSFEDLTDATGSDVRPPLVIARDGIATIPGWTADTLHVGGWNGAVAAAATHGAVYAFAASEAELTLTSDAASGHLSAAGDTYRVSFDAGSSNGTSHYYEVRIQFGDNSRLVGAVFEGANVTTTGAVRHTMTFTASASDAGHHPSLRIYVRNQGNISQAFLDNVEWAVAESSPSVPSMDRVDSEPSASIGRTIAGRAEQNPARFSLPNFTVAPVVRIDQALADWRPNTDHRITARRPTDASSAEHAPRRNPDGIPLPF